MPFRAFAGILMVSVVGFGADRKFEAIYANPAMQAAVEDLSSKKIAAIVAQQNLEKVLVQASASATPANDPVIAAAQNKAEAAATDVKVAATKVLAQPDSQLAPKDKVKELEDAVDEIQLQAAQNANSSNNLYLEITIVGILLALGASVAGFLKKSVIAGVLSLCAGTAGGAPKAIGIDGTGDFYQQLYDGASSLASDIKFDVVVTLQDYNGYVTRLKALQAHSAPGASKSRDAAKALMNELLAAKTPHKD
jgi:hypothetical protein